jgi:outer membrane lipoprotein carrier protein
MKALMAFMLLLAQAATPKAAPPAKPAPAAVEKEAPPARADDAKPAPAAKEEPKSTPEGIALAEKVQKFYEKTSDFSADFLQMYKYKGVIRTRESSGTMQVKKPGFMRWDYEKPYKQLFLVDGKSLFIYEPTDNAVQVKKNFASNELSAAVTFLWGRGKLVDSFHVSKVDKPTYGSTVLELIPKKPESGFTKVYFVVNDETGGVQKSIVFDSAGNENRVTFSNMKANQNVPESRFKFDIPKGAQVQQLPN